MKSAKLNLVISGLLSLLPLSGFTQTAPLQEQKPVSASGIKISVECYRLPRKEAQAFFLEAKSNTIIKENILKVRKSLDTKEAGYTLLASGSILVKSGERAQVESVEEVIYPSAYRSGNTKEKTSDPQTKTPPVSATAEPDNKNPSWFTNLATAREETLRLGLKMLNPATFEMRYIGFICEVGPIIEDDQQTLRVALDPKIVGLKDWIIHNGTIQPIFYTHRIDTVVKLLSGEASFLGSWTPRPEEVVPDSDLLEVMVMEAEVVKK